MSQLSDALGGSDKVAGLVGGLATGVATLFGGPALGTAAASVTGLVVGGMKKDVANPAPVTPTIIRTAAPTVPTVQQVQAQKDNTKTYIIAGGAAAAFLLVVVLLVTRK